MYYILRKSIILIAGLGLLFLSSCKTVVDSEYKEVLSLGFENLFNSEFNTNIYVDINDNRSLISSLLESKTVNKSVSKIIDNSNRIFLGYNTDITSGFDGVINGYFSKSKMEFGLFLSFSWKKRGDKVKYWVNRDGIKLYFENDNRVIVSTRDIVPIIERVRGVIIDPPAESIMINLTDVSSDLLKKISNGYIKNGIDGILITLDNSSGLYSFIGTLNLETNSKASAFSRMLKLFFRLFLSTSDDEDIANIGKSSEIDSVDNLIIIKIVDIKEKKLRDLLNNIILLEGEADK